MKKQFFIGVLVSGVCLYFVFRDISFSDIWSVLRQAQPSWIVAALLLYLVDFMIRAFRWRILLRPMKSLSARTVFSPMMLGFFANNILPFRMGEFVRAHLAGQKFGISRTAALGTILLERLCDTLAFLTTFAIVAISFPFPPKVEKAALLLGLMCVAIIVTLFVIIRFQAFTHALLGKLPVPATWRARLVHTVENFAHGVSGMKDFSSVSKAMLLSLVIWLFEGTFLYLIGKSLSVPLGFPQSFFLLFFMGLSVTLPQAPGYVGTLELFGTTALRLLGIPKEQGLPMILTIHACQFLFVITAGILILSKEHLSVGSMVRGVSERPDVA